jgi:hypothetical protein
MDSIMQNKKRCYVCGLYAPVEEHHIFFGNPNRRISEENGFKVWLCAEHHRGTMGVHGKLGHVLDIKLKQECEKKYLNKEHTIEEFIRLIGKNYL